MTLCTHVNTGIIKTMTNLYTGKEVREKLSLGIKKGGKKIPGKMEKGK